MVSVKKPTKEDANILLQLEGLLLMEPNYKAMYWFWRVFHPQRLETAEEIRRTYPATSEGQRNLDRIAAFWESAGTLVKNKLLNEDLFFDRFLVTPYWNAIKPGIFLDRQDTNEPRLSENFEWLAVREESRRREEEGEKRSSRKTKSRQ
jgi:hypothetical protein